MYAYDRKFHILQIALRFTGKHSAYRYVEQNLELFVQATACTNTKYPPYFAHLKLFLGSCISFVPSLACAVPVVSPTVLQKLKGMGRSNYRAGSIFEASKVDP